MDDAYPAHGAWNSSLLADLLQRVLDDRALGIAYPVGHYQALYPGFEAEVREALAGLDWSDAAVARSSDPQEVLDIAWARELGREGLELEGRLGKGAQGEVFRAWDPALQRAVAIKRLARSALLHPSAQRRFEREARCLARLDHPGVARVLKLCAHRDPAWYAMELILGEDLSARIGRLGAPTDAQEARLRIEILIGLAEALAAAHDQGIIHRDVKPSNVIVRADGRPVLVDFGVAKDLAAPLATVGSDRLGTPAYMAPEQALQMDAVDHRADIYGLGVMAIELLSGERPRRPGPAGARELFESAPRGLRLALDAPCRLALRRLLRRMLASDPGARPARAAEIAGALRLILRRRPTRQAQLAIVAAVLGGLACAATVLRPPADTEALVPIGAPLIAAIAPNMEVEIGEAYALLSSGGETAIQRFEALLQRYPHREEIWLGRALLDVNAKRYDRVLEAAEREGLERPSLRWLAIIALEELDRASDAASLEQSLRAPESESEHLAAAFVALYERAPRRLRDPVRAREHVDAALRHARRARLLHMEARAFSFLWEDDPALRERAADEFVRVWPVSGRAHYWRGALLRDEDTQRARAAFERAVELAPEVSEHHASLAHIRWQRGDLDGALTACAAALALRPSEVGELHQLRDFLLRAANRGEEADRLAFAAAEERPDDPVLACLEAEVAFRRLDFERGRRAAARAATHGPDEPSVLLLKAVVATFDARLDETARWLALAAERYPRHERVLLAQGRFLLQVRRDPKAALRAMGAGAERLRTSLELQELMAQAALRAGEEEIADRALQAAFRAGTTREDLLRATFERAQRGSDQRLVFEVGMRWLARNAKPESLRNALCALVAAHPDWRDELLQHCDRLSRAPGASERLASLVDLALGLDDGVRAQAYAEEFVALEPTAFASWFALFRAARRAGDVVRAAEAEREALARGHALQRLQLRRASDEAP